MILELAIRPEQLHRELLDAQVQVGGAELHHRALGTGLQTLELTRQLPIAGVLERLRLAGEARDRLADVAVFPRRTAVALDLLASSPSCRTSTIISVRPPWIVRSNIMLVIATIQPWFFWPTRLAFGTFTSSKKTWLKPCSPVIWIQRTNRHSGAFHIDQQIAQPPMLGRLGIGAAQQGLKSA